MMFADYMYIGSTFCFSSSALCLRCGYRELRGRADDGHKTRIDELSEVEVKAALKWFVNAWTRMVVPSDFIDKEKYMDRCEMIANHYLTEALNGGAKNEQESYGGGTGGNHVGG